MKTFAAALFASIASAEVMQQMDYEFMKWISEHGKRYETVEEFNLRKSLFALVDIHVRNVNSNPNSTYTAAHNRMSDMSAAEREEFFSLKHMPKPIYDERNVVETDIANLPTSFDWRDEGKVTAVKDQGNCGSCWAFSSIEAIESAWMIAGNDEVIMSEQELVDCSSETGNEGCNGGWYFWSYEWLADHYTMAEKDYPYTATDNSCKYDESKGVTEVTDYKQVRGTSAILSALADQPVNVAVAAGNFVFSYYNGGIITTDSGCPNSIDHAIVAVGWGEEDGVQYYIVRNSWGTSWGEDGYVRIQTSTGRGVCGINQYVYYPIL